MTEQEIKNITASNIIKYRKSAGITQLQLAEMLNYSDKAVSKWERAESLPDIYVLCKMSELFGITVSELIGEEKKEKTKNRTEENDEKKTKNRKFITAMSVCLVWFVMSILFAALKIVDFALFPVWLVYIYALPLSCVVLLVFSCLWWGIPLQAASVSGIIWFTVLSVFLTVTPTKTAYLFIPAAVFQLLTILWFRFRAVSKTKKKSKGEKK